MTNDLVHKMEVAHFISLLVFFFYTYIFHPHKYCNTLRLLPALPTFSPQFSAPLMEPKMTMNHTCVGAGVSHLRLLTNVAQKDQGERFYVVALCNTDTHTH